MTGVLCSFNNWSSNYISYYCFMNTSMHFEFPTFFMLLLHKAFHILSQYNAYVFTHQSCILFPQ